MVTRTGRWRAVLLLGGHEHPDESTSFLVYKYVPQPTGCALVTLKDTYLHVKQVWFHSPKGCTKVCSKLRWECGIPKAVAFCYWSICITKAVYFQFSCKSSQAQYFTGKFRSILLITSVIGLLNWFQTDYCFKAVFDYFMTGPIRNNLGKMLRKCCVIKTLT